MIKQTAVSPRIILILLACCITAHAGTLTDKDTNLHFPDQIGEWKRTDVLRFQDRNAGVEINYKSLGAAIASFVIYSGGISKIPTGAENSVVERQFAIDAQGSMAYVQNRAKDVSKVLDSKPDISFHGKRATLLVTAFQFSGDKKWLQFLLMTGYKNRFLKLIYTQPFNNIKTDVPEGQKKLRDLILNWLDKNDENRDAFWQ
jgi:hypothetical protein